jgi:hypothetical protein
VPSDIDEFRRGKMDGPDFRVVAKHFEMRRGLY